MSDPPKPVALTPKQIRQQLLEEHQQRVRRQLAGPIAGAPLLVRESGQISTAELATIQAAASARVAEREKAATTGPQALGKKVPLAARIATAHPDRMINMPVCEADLPKYKGRPFGKEAWLAALKKALAKHDFGNVHHGIVRTACEELAKAAVGGRGMVRMTYEQWAGLSECCRSTIHKIIRALWDLELVRIANPFYWVGREQRRAANVYFPTIPAADAETAVAEAPASSEPETTADAAPPIGAVKAIQRMAAGVRELLPVFPGLYARVFGLNTSPLRQERRAAPA